jgi:hypothetical protein
MRPRASIFQALTLLLLAPALLRADAQAFASAGQSLSLFGRLGSARLAALGGSFNSLVQGADGLMVNPAGLAGVDAVQIGLHHETWLAGINQESLYAVTPMEGGQGFGAYAHIIDYGTFEIRDSSGQRLGTIDARDYAVGAGYGIANRLGFSGGLGIRGVRENLLKDDLFSLAVDAGLNWQGKDGWSGGLAAVNLGSSLNGRRGAESVRWGVSRKAELGHGYLWPALAFSWEPHSTPSLSIGAEAGLGRALALRVGYEQRFVETLLEGVYGLTLGLGFHMGPVGFDYAFLPYGDLGAGHRVTLTWTQPPWPHMPAPLATTSPSPTPQATPEAQVEVPAPKTDLVYVKDPLSNAKAMESEGRLAEALADYERVVADDPKLAGAWRAIAELATKLKDKPKAIAAYHHLLALQPDPELSAWLKRFEAEP